MRRLCKMALSPSCRCAPRCLHADADVAGSEHMISRPIMTVVSAHAGEGALMQAVLGASWWSTLLRITANVAVPACSAVSAPGHPSNLIDCKHSGHGGATCYQPGSWVRQQLRPSGSAAHMVMAAAAPPRTVAGLLEHVKGINSSILSRLQGRFQSYEVLASCVILRSL